MLIRGFSSVKNKLRLRIIPLRKKSKKTIETKINFLFFDLL